MELSLQSIETLLVEALKAKDSIKVDVMRALKTRIQNLQIEKQTQLTTEDILALIKSELKKRKEALEAYTLANRSDAASKESAEIEILQQFLPAQLSEEQIIAQVAEEAKKHNWSSLDFGLAMKTLSAKFAGSADGALVAKALKTVLGK